MTGIPDRSQGWVDHFLENREGAKGIPWDEDVPLTESERAAITSSIQTFQLGESSDGGHFIDLAQRWATESGDPAYGDAVRLFIAEENRHSELLGRFMDGQGIDRVQHQWSDRLFRWMRKRAGLELCIRVLIAAEIIAKVYYRALRDATLSPVLNGICTQILWDEAHHIAFQGSAIHRLQRQRSAPARWLAKCAYRGFMVGTIAVVWFEHGRALRAGHYTLVRFVGETLCELEDALLWMDGEWDTVQVRSDAELIDLLLLRAGE